MPNLVQLPPKNRYSLSSSSDEDDPSYLLREDPHRIIVTSESEADIEEANLTSGKTIQKQSRIMDPYSEVNNTDVLDDEKYEMVEPNLGEILSRDAKAIVVFRRADYAFCHSREFELFIVRKKFFKE